MMTAAKQRWAYKWLSGSVLVAVLAVGHLLFWYSPRARRGRPSGDTLTGRLVLSEEGLPLRLWIPFPHQNLAHLEGRAEVASAVDRALRELTALRLDEVPSFGPFRLPPAHELMVASDEDRDHVIVAIRMYPMIRWLLRAAGAIAGNPWLAGGELQIGNREIHVRWADGEWIAETSSGVQAEADGSAAEPAALAMLRLTDPFGLIPAGLYSLDVQSGQILIASVGEEFSTRLSDSSLVTTSRAALVSVEFPDPLSREEIRAVALFAPDETSAAVSPGAVVLVREAQERWVLPGEKLLSMIGVRPVMKERDDWEIWGYDERSLLKGESVVQAIETLRSLDSSREVTYIGGLDLDKARSAIETIDGIVRSVPIVGAVEARRWSLMLSMLEALADYSRLQYRVGKSPTRLQVVID